MRSRSTWQSNGNETPRQAATSRKADIYTMNQDHPQPSAVEYESGSPDSWAETPVPGDKMNVNAEYDGDHVKRNEIGLGEMRDDTYKHKDSEHWGGPGKYDNAKLAAARKAQGAERIARAILRTSNTKLIEDTAIDLMAMPEKTMVATLRRIDLASPRALPQEARLRRALSCTKLATNMLGAAASEPLVEKLAHSFMEVEDRILKSMLSTVREARVAQDQAQQDQGQDEPDQSHQAQGDSEEEEEQDAPPAQQAQDTQQDDESGVEAETASEGCLSPEETSLLDQILLKEAEQHGIPAAGPADDLTAIFDPPAAPMAPAAPVLTVPAIAAAVPGGVGITFDDEDDAPARTASADDSALDDLFGSDPEVQAQRQIRASEQEQSARAGGYSIGRTASIKAAPKGAKKIGQVQRAPALSADAALERLWDD